jgi:hypothetical protein
MVGVTNIVLLNKPLEDKVYRDEDILESFKISTGHKSTIKNRKIDALIKQTLSKEHTDGFMDKGEI